MNPFIIAGSAEATQSRAMERTFRPAVYMVVNGRNGTIYVCVASDLPKRAWQHREGEIDGFSKRYGCKLLVWFELHATMEYAILREKQLKGGSRKRKVAFIEAGNATWRDLYPDLFG